MAQLCNTFTYVHGYLSLVKPQMGLHPKRCPIWKNPALLVSFITMIFPLLIFKFFSPCSSFNLLSALKSNALFRWIFVKSGVKYILLKTSFSQFLSRLFTFNICLFWSNTSTVESRQLAYRTIGRHIFWDNSSTDSEKTRRHLSSKLIDRWLVIIIGNNGN